MNFVLQHTRLGFCWLDLIALVVLIVVIVVFFRQHKKLKEKEEELEDRLSAVYAAKVDPASEQPKQ